MVVLESARKDDVRVIFSLLASQEQTEEDVKTRDPRGGRKSHGCPGAANSRQNSPSTSGHGTP